jgi:flagellar biosynthesis/type III secretory pathway protein FliH
LAHGAGAVRAALQARARAAGEQAGRQEAALLLERAAELAALQAEEARGQVARASVELALEIARTLLRSEIGRGHYDLEAIVRETLAQAATGRGACVVHLNPTDHAHLREVRFRSGTRLEPDPGVARGNVHVETALGLLVRDLDDALDSIGQRLQEEHA